MTPLPIRGSFTHSFIPSLNRSRLSTRPGDGPLRGGNIFSLGDNSTHNHNSLFSPEFHTELPFPLFRKCPLMKPQSWRGEQLTRGHSAWDGQDGANQGLGDLGRPPGANGGPLDTPTPPTPPLLCAPRWGKGRSKG